MKRKERKEEEIEENYPIHILYSSYRVSKMRGKHLAEARGEKVKEQRKESESRQDGSVG